MDGEGAGAVVAGITVSNSVVFPTLSTCLSWNKKST